MKTAGLIALAAFGLGIVADAPGLGLLAALAVMLTQAFRKETQ